MDDAERIAPGGILDGRYRLEKVIGAGGMASVWLAHDENLGRPVAVKALSDALTADPAYVARFEREARIAAGLSHPNLVQVLDSGTAGQRPYLVMEHVQGPTLAEVLEKGRVSLDPEQLARELLGALGNIHAAGVIHRDVKPANVLIGDDGRARLTDFGIARPEDATDLTKTGQVIGTLRYMAPEVMEGKRADERSDLYSCGVVLRECTAERPGGELGRLIRRLTARRPRRRPRSAQAALAVLGEGALPTRVAAEAKTEPLGDRPTAPTERLPASRPETAPGDRGKWLLALAAAIALAGGLLVAGTVGDDSADRAGSGEPTRKACAVLKGRRIALAAQRRALLEGVPDDGRAAFSSELQRRARALDRAIRSCERRSAEPSGDAAPTGSAPPPPPTAPAAEPAAPAGEPAPAGEEAAGEGNGDGGGTGKGPKPGKGPKQGKGKGKGKGK